MDFFKIKCKHIHDDLTDAEIGRLIRFQKKVAEVERMLTDREIKAIFKRNDPQMLEKRLQIIEQNPNICLTFVAQKVLEDVQKVQQKRNLSKQNSANYREKLKNGDYDTNKSRHCTDKIREDKRREDIYNPPTPLKGDTGLSSGSVVKKEFDFSFLPDQFKTVFMDWIEYKKSRREKYKNQKSLEAAYKHLLNLSNSDLSIAEKIIQQSMANNWAGLFELKNNGNQKGAKSGYTVGIDKNEYHKLRETLFPDQ